MSPAVKAALFLIVLFAIPIVPFLWLGESFEQSLLKALREPSSPLVVSGWVIGLLAAVIQRGVTGRGCTVDGSLYETALNWMTIPIATASPCSSSPYPLRASKAWANVWP